MVTFRRLLVLTLFASLALSGAALAQLAGPGANASWAKPGILAWGTEDGEFRWWVDGRIYLDFASYSEGDAAMGDGVELRRGRLGFKSILWGTWMGELDIDYADNEVDVKDMWIAYSGWENTLLKIGQHREPFSMEEVTSSRYITFMERSLANVFTVGRTLGASYTRWGSSWRFSTGVFGQEIGTEADNDDAEDEGHGFAARFSFAPLHQSGRVLHLGVAGYTRTPDAGSGDKVKWKTESETHVEGEDFLDTGKIKKIEDYSGLGLELAGQFGDFQFQGEYLTLDVSRYDGEVDASFDGYYLQATYLVFGDPRPYKVDEGEFVDPGTVQKGALELAVRYSTVDLNDFAAGVEGGEGEDFTLALNYYFNRNVKFKVEYVDADLDGYADANGDFPGNNSFSVLQARLQLLF